MKIDRSLLIEADKQDGKEDGFLTREQLPLLGDMFDAEVAELGLLTVHDEQSLMTRNDEVLPYAQYLNRFEEGSDFWDELKATNIPLGDALFLGKQIQQLRERNVIQFKDPSGKNQDATVNPKSIDDLWKEIIEKLPDIKLDTKDWSLVSKYIFSPTSESDAKVIFKSAIDHLLNKLQSDGRLKPDNAIRQQANQKLLGIDVYHHHGKEARQAIIQRTAAILVYQAHYFFPSLENDLLGKSNMTVALTFYSRQLGHSYNSSTNSNPFAIEAVNDPMIGFLQAGGHYQPEDGSLAFRADLLQSGTQKSKTTIEARQISIHELGHKVHFEKVPDLSHDFKVKFEEIVNYFASLPPNKYKDIFGSLYGNRAWQDPSYEYFTEAHSCLVQLTERGDNFPEQIAATLQNFLVHPDQNASRWSQKEIREVKSKLEEFRILVAKSVWGYQGHPAWARRFH